VNRDKKIILLAGGAGGAKLAAGLVQLLPPQNLTIVGNTGDDFVHCGLTICPDLDHLIFKLSDALGTTPDFAREPKNDMQHTIEASGGPDWVQLNNVEWGMSVTRTELLNEGKTLTEITQLFCEKFGIPHTLLPMSDTPSPTYIRTKDGEELSFQDWYIKRQWQPEVAEIMFPAESKTSAPLLKALNGADIVIIGPSNPFVSISPILDVYPVRPTVTDVPDVVVAVTPIIAGEAVKGPAAKLLHDLRLPRSVAGVLGYYSDLLDGFVYDTKDEGLLDDFGVPLLCVETYMSNMADCVKLAQQTLDFAYQLMDGES